MFCKHCGAELADDAKFCATCGQAVEEETTQQPAPAPIEEAPAPAPTAEAPAPAAPVPEAPQKKEYTKTQSTFLLIGAIAAFLSILFSFGLFFAGGLSISGFSYLTVTDYFNFSANGLIRSIIKSLSHGTIDGVIGSLFSVMIIFATLLVLIVELIKGIIAFIAAIQGKDYSKILKPAVGAWSGLAVGMIFLLAINAASADGLSIGLNGGALAGLCLSAIFIGVYLLMHVFVGGKNMLKFSFIIKLVFAGGGIIVGGIITGLASGSVLVINGSGQSFIKRFFDSITSVTGSSAMTRYIYVALGFISTLTLISAGLEFIKRAIINVGDAVDGTTSKKRSILTTAIAGLVFAIVLVVASFLYASAVHGTLNPAIPIVIALFSVLGVVMYALEGPIVKKVEAKEKAAAEAKAANAAANGEAFSEVTANEVPQVNEDAPVEEVAQTPLSEDDDDNV